MTELVEHEVWTAPDGSRHLLTPWMPPDWEPRMIGVYQRDSLAGTIRYSLWDGHRWMWNAERLDKALDHCCAASLVQHLRWRGLTAPPRGGYGTRTPS